MNTTSEGHITVPMPSAPPPYPDLEQPRAAYEEIYAQQRFTPPHSPQYSQPIVQQREQVIIQIPEQEEQRVVYAPPVPEQDLSTVIYLIACRAFSFLCFVTFITIFFVFLISLYS